MFFYEYFCDSQKNFYIGDFFLGKYKRKTKKMHQVNNANRNHLQLNGFMDNDQSSDGINIENNIEFTKDTFNKIPYLENMVSKQLNLYTWCEEKVSTLATINAIMLAAITLFIENIEIRNLSLIKKTDSLLECIKLFIDGHFYFTITLLMVLPIFVSLTITLWHVIPKMRSGASANSILNHRSVIGIHKFNKLEDYKSYIDNLTSNDIYDHIIRQIYGMNKNIWRNQQSIKIAVICDLIGLLGFLIVIIYISISNNLFIK